MSAYDDALKAGGVPVDAPAVTPYDQALKAGGVPYDPGILDRAGEAAMNVWDLVTGKKAGTATTPGAIMEPDAFGMVPLEDPGAAFTGAAASAVDLSKGIVQGIAAGGAAALAAPAAVIGGKPELIPEAYRAVAEAAPMEPVWKAVLPKGAEKYREGINQVLSAPKIAGDIAAEAVFEKTGSPIWAAATATAFEGAPILAGMGKAFGRIPKPVLESTWYRKLTIPERGLVLSSVDQMKASGMSEADIIRIRPEEWKKAYEARGGGKYATPPAETPVPVETPPPEAPVAPPATIAPKVEPQAPPAPASVVTPPRGERRAADRPMRSSFREDQVPDLETVDKDLAAVQANLDDLAKDYKEKESITGAEGTMARLEVTDRMNRWHDSFDALEKRKQEIIEGAPPAPVVIEPPKAIAPKPASVVSFEKARAERPPEPRKPGAIVTEAAGLTKPEPPPAPAAPDYAAEASKLGPNVVFSGIQESPLGPIPMFNEDPGVGSFVIDPRKGEKTAAEAYARKVAETKAAEPPAVTWKKAAIIPTRAGVKAVPIEEASPAAKNREDGLNSLLFQLMKNAEPARKALWDEYLGKYGPTNRTPEALDAKSELIAKLREMDVVPFPKKATSEAIIPEVLPPDEEQAATPAALTAAAKIAGRVKAHIQSGITLESKDLFRMADEAHGGTQAEGKYTVKDAYDAMELGVNKAIEGSMVTDPRIGAPEAVKQIGALRDLVAKLPTQTKRTGEMDAFQQFSTPPALGFAANWVANIRPGETYLEPSAGIGGLAIFGKNAGAKVIVNELSPRRAEMLKELGFEKVFTENAEQLNNVLPKDVVPTVVVMNPPFSATAGRMGDKMETMTGARHVEQALKRLAPGGRLVAIVGRGMAPGAPTFGQWWKKISDEYTVKANVGVSGKEYTKYGTSFDNRVLVIDKIGAGIVKAGGPITGDVDRIEDLIGLLQGVRNGRPSVATGEVATEPKPPESPVQAGAGVPQGSPGPEVPVLPAVGKPRPGTGPVPVEGPGAAAHGGRDAVVEPGERAEVPRGKRAGGTERAGAEAPAEPGAVGGVDLGGSGAQVEPPVSVELPVDAPEGLDVKKAATKLAGEDFSDSVFENYRPQKALVPGAKTHPGKLVESAAMSIVEPPDATYSPKLPKELITSGKLSEAQLESIIYAGQSHSEMLPGTRALNGVEVPYRKGYFIGDGTGVGKGREIAGVLLDNWNQGRKRALWISQNSPLIDDAKRDVNGIGWDPKLIFDFSKTKLGAPIQAKEGIAFLGYDLLKTKPRTKIAGAVAGKSRLEQIVDWLGPDYDGVIVFDEAHNMGNALAMLGKMGMSKPSEKALAGVDLQAKLPNARVLYVSATGATEVTNLSYADRLGLWGEGTPFANKRDFIEKISAGGIAAMEMVARDMKAMGNYLARSLSYDDVSYEKLEHPLTPEQKNAYDELATAWQGVLQNVHAALKITSGNDRGKPNSRAKSAAMSAFWGAHQRFFNQVITSMQTPSVIASIEKDLKAGHSAVVQLVNTNAAAQERALARLEEDMELEDLDMTPREQLMEYVKNSFPVAQYEQYLDENGNVQSQIALDSKGAPVENAEAVALREMLLDKLGSIKVSDGPLEMLLNHFGTDLVAEVTGRQRRVVMGKDETGTHKIVEKWSTSKSTQDADLFAKGKKQILIFSYAGGTGRSYHADLGIKNQALRRHYLLQAGWRADRAIQGFGRTHRSSQKQAPEYVLVTTDIKGQKRFISSIARRLDQLGALTRGQRQSGGQGFFAQRDNLESQYATAALRNLIEDLSRRNVAGMDIHDFQNATGLKILDDKGNLSATMPEITSFLNRLLSMTVDMQDKVFDLFSERMDKQIQRAVEDGTLDQGLETLRAKKVEKLQEQTVYTDKSGAETKHIELEVTQDAYILKFDQTKKHAGGGYVQNIKSGRIYASSVSRTYTDKHGDVRNVHGLTAIDYSRHNIPVEDMTPEKYKKLTGEEAKALWDKEIAATPPEIKHREHLITGAMLPVWDRLVGHPRIMRVQTSEGERFIGRLLNDSDVNETLRNLGASQTAVKMTPQELHANVLKHGYTVELANGWEIKRRKVAGDYRIEVVGPDYEYIPELKKHGAFTERIAYETRVFVPTGPEGIKTLEAITANRPVVSANPPAATKAGLPGRLGDEAGFLNVSALRPVADAVRELSEWYMKPTEFGTMKKIIGKYTGSLQEIDFKLTEAAREINERIPKKETQVAITNYMQAGGDMELLRRRAAASPPQFRQGYEDAMSLTPEEQGWADGFRQRYDDIWEMAADAGILEAYVENYVRGEWVRPDRAGRKLMAQVNAGVLNTKPREAMKKVFQTYFDGEAAGFTPKDKRIGYQVIAAERSIQHAIASRKALKAMMGSKEADGRPSVVVGGSGHYINRATLEDEKRPFLIKPNTKPNGTDTTGYKFLDHPALRKWKWIGKDTEGNPILLEGNMWIHPEAYGRINALVGRSKIASFTIPEKVPVIGGTQPGRAALRAGAFIKGTILIGPFHQFHVGEHALFHKVNPFRAPKINFDRRPLLREGVEHGLMLYNHNALHEFGEGLASGGLWHKVPILGDGLRWYQEWLFQDYIPRLKAAMYEHAVERAEKYFEKELANGTLTRDQLLENVAMQSNAAFGEQNYKYLGRNPTVQDALRIGLLAPDFLEARLRFAGQAAKPYGREQLYALLRGALLMATTAQIINLLFGDDKKIHLDKPFSVLIGGREYTPRSVVGDIAHLFADPRSFWYHRLNPLWGRPVAEVATGRDFYGKKVDLLDAAKDILKSWIPIPAQGIVKENAGDSFAGAVINSTLQSIGMSNYPYKSKAAKLVQELSPRVDRPLEKKEREYYYLKRKAVDMLRKGKQWGDFPDGMKEKLNALSDEQLDKIDKEADRTLLDMRFTRLTMDQKIRVWKIATPEERNELEETYNAAIERYTPDLNDEEYAEFQKRIEWGEK